MKTNKTLWRLSVATTSEAEDAVAELLQTSSGRPSSSYFNHETQISTVSVFGLQKIILSNAIRKNISAGLKHIQSCGLNIGPGKIRAARVRREDWSESWKRHFQPIEIQGDKRRRSKIETSLLIKPSWSKKRARKNQALVVLDPGLSFGTGQHPTTKFCLREIVTAVQNRRNQHRPGGAGAKSFLDIGTGSGILAIAAAKLGCRPVCAFDFDREAVRIARLNARANRVGPTITIVRGDVAKLSLRPSQRYDLVCANLISNVLIAERRRIAAQLSSGGTLVLAGILRSEFLEVQRAFAELGLRLIRGRNEREWRSGAFSAA